MTLCNPQKSSKSIIKNPERNAAIIQQKHIIVYRKNGDTIINYLHLPKKFLEAVFPDDKDFPENIKESCRKRIEIIEKSL